MGERENEKKDRKNRLVANEGKRRAVNLLWRRSAEPRDALLLHLCKAKRKQRGVTTSRPPPDRSHRRHRRHHCHRRRSALPLSPFVAPSLKRRQRPLGNHLHRNKSIF